MSISFRCTAVVIFTLATITVDQWIHVHKPFRYHALVTKWRMCLFIILLWMLGFIVCSPYFYDQVDFVYIADAYVCILDMVSLCNRSGALIVKVIVILPSFTVIFACTISTARTAHLHARKIQATHANLVPMPQSRKHLKTTFIIICASVIMWIPMCAVQLIDLIDDKPMNSMLIYVVVWSLISNSYINWIICLLTDRTFRHSTLDILGYCCTRKKKGKNSSRHSLPSNTTRDSRINSIYYSDSIS